jgi:hypothetical protein
MRYEIPEENVEALRKQIARAQNKGAKIDYVEGTPFMAQVGMKGPEGFKTPVYHRFVPVTVEGKYEINGWKFVGVIEHKDGGNIIRCADSSVSDKIPSKYLTAPAECEHCHTSRNRNDTYLIMNEKTNEFMQVGRTCLKDFTGGMDADACAASAECLKDAEESQNEEKEYTPKALSLSGDAVREVAFAIVSKYGYIKRNGLSGVISTEIQMQNQLIDVNGPFDSIPDEEENIKKVNEWLKSQDCSNGYMANAKTAWEASYVEVRDFSLIASLVSAYLKSIKTKEETKNSEYAGKIGDKVSFVIVYVRALYTLNNRMFSEYAEPSVVYELRDANGNVYTWATSANVIGMYKDGMTHITATIKNLKEFRGIKQTVITRGKMA